MLVESVVPNVYYTLPEHRPDADGVWCKRCEMRRNEEGEETYGRWEWVHFGLVPSDVLEMWRA